MRISVIGAGNIGTAIVADLSRNHEVIVYSSKAEKFKSTIEYIDNQKKLCFESGGFLVTNQYDIAVKNADIIFVALPTFLIENVVGIISQYADRKTMVGFVPGAGGVEYIARPLIERGNTVFAFERTPYVSRIKKYGESVYASKKPKARIATLPWENENEVASLISELFEISCSVIHSFLAITFTPTLHISRCYSMFKNVDKYSLIVGENPLFYKDWRDEDSIICLKVDEELHRVADAIDATGICMDELIPYTVHYESSNEKELTMKIRSIPSLREIKSPIIEDKNVYKVDVESRYFTESFPYRLAVVEGFADIFDVDVPIIDEILEWYAHIKNKNFYIDGQFIGSDVNECNIPQKFGLETIEHVLEFYKY